MSALFLKIFACVFMTLDHIGYNIYSSYPTLYTCFRAVGRIAFPLFAYMIASGYRNTKDPFKYMLRLLVFGIISEPIYDTVFFGRVYAQDQNIMFTLTLGILAIMFFEKLATTPVMTLLALIPVAVICRATHILAADYDFYAIILILLLYIFDPHIESRKNKKAFYFSMTTFSCLLFSSRSIIMHFATTSLKRMGTYAGISFLADITPVYLNDWGRMALFSVFAIPFILLYNGKRGINIKNKLWSKVYQYSFYVYYPLHLIIIGLAFHRFGK